LGSPTLLTSSGGIGAISPRFGGPLHEACMPDPWP